MICCFSNYFKVFAHFSLFKGNRHGVLLDRHICLYSIPDSVSILLVCNLFLRLKSSSNSKVIEHTIRRSEGTPFIKSFMNFKKYVFIKISPKYIRILIFSRFRANIRPCPHDISLLQLASPVPSEHSAQFLPPCEDKAPIGVVLGASGMGTTSILHKTQESTFSIS